MHWSNGLWSTMTRIGIIKHWVFATTKVAWRKKVNWKVNSNDMGTIGRS
jgi:hypothetical protein